MGLTLKKCLGNTLYIITDTYKSGSGFSNALEEFYMTFAEYTKAGTEGMEGDTEYGALSPSLFRLSSRVFH